MTKSDIIKEVAEGTGLTKVEIEAVLDGVIHSISESLKRGERVDSHKSRDRSCIRWCDSQYFRIPETGRARGFTRVWQFYC